MADGLTFKISMTGLNRLIKKMDDIEVGITRVTVKAGKEIAELGVKEAQANFANAKYDGVNDVEVTKKRTADGKWNVIATGKSAAFIEYGTGYGRGQYSGAIPPRFNGPWTGEDIWGTGPTWNNYQGDKAGWIFIEKPGTTYTAGGNPYGKWRHSDGRYREPRSGHTYGFTPGGNIPNECMLNAKKVMARESVKIARTALKRYVFL